MPTPEQVLFRARQLIPMLNQWPGPEELDPPATKWATTTYATIGNLDLFIVASPEQFESRREFYYAVHEVVQDRPRLQWIANELEVIQMRFRFHAMFSQPQVAYDQLVKRAEAHEAMALVFGNGVHRGLFVITALGQTIMHQDADGSLILIDLDVQLTEYASASAVEQEAAPTEPPPAVEPSNLEQPGTSVVSSTPAPIEVTGPLNVINDPTRPGYIPPANACREPSIAPGVFPS